MCKVAPESWIELSFKSALCYQARTLPRNWIIRTTKEQRQRSQRSIFSLESLQQRRQSKYIHESMKKVCMYQREGIRSIHYTNNFISHPFSMRKRSYSSGEEKEDELVAKPISFGINAPHCCTSHALCKLTNQSSTITRIIQRVKRGRRKIYERARAAENWGRLGGIVLALSTGRVGNFVRE
jgi:hypothetical protein